LYSTSAGYSGNGVEKGVSRAEEDLNDAQKAVKRAQESLDFYIGILEQNEEMLDKWKEANPEYTGEEMRFKFLKGEVDSARASFDSARASFDSANAFLNNTSSFYQKLIGKGIYVSSGPFAFSSDRSTETKHLFDMAYNVTLPEDGFPAVVGVDRLLNELFQHDSKLLFVRECYQQFYNIALGIGTSRIVLSGTPGIGKSISLLYIIIRRVKLGHPVCFHDLEFGTSWLFANGTCQKFKRGFLPDNQDLHHNTNYIVLLNNAKGEVF
jgi:hypothetical protein